MSERNRLRDTASDTVRGGISAAMIGVVSVVVVLIVMLVGVFGFGWFQQGTAGFRGETNKKNQVEGSGAYRIAAYDHFFDLCAAVQSNESSIMNLQKELDGKPRESRAEQINASITALRNQRNASISEYNTDADKDYTAGQFRSSKLPFKLDPNTEETSCVA